MHNRIPRYKYRFWQRCWYTGINNSFNKGILPFDTARSNKQDRKLGRWSWVDNKSFFSFPFSINRHSEVVKRLRDIGMILEGDEWPLTKNNSRKVRGLKYLGNGLVHGSFEADEALMIDRSKTGQLNDRIIRAIGPSYNLFRRYAIWSRSVSAGNSFWLPVVTRSSRFSWNRSTHATRAKELRLASMCVRGEALAGCSIAPIAFSASNPLGPSIYAECKSRSREFFSPLVDRFLPCRFLLAFHPRRYVVTYTTDDATFDCLLQSVNISYRFTRFWKISEM